MSVLIRVSGGGAGAMAAVVWHAELLRRELELTKSPLGSDQWRQIVELYARLLPRETMSYAAYTVLWKIAKGELRVRSVERE